MKYKVIRCDEEHVTLSRRQAMLQHKCYQNRSQLDETNVCRCARPDCHNRFTNNAYIALESWTPSTPVTPAREPRSPSANRTISRRVPAFTSSGRDGDTPLKSFASPPMPPTVSTNKSTPKKRPTLMEGLAVSSGSNKSKKGSGNKIAQSNVQQLCASPPAQTQLHLGQASLGHESSRAFSSSSGTMGAVIGPSESSPWLGRTGFENQSGTSCHLAAALVMHGVMEYDSQEAAQLVHDDLVNVEATPCSQQLYAVLQEWREHKRASDITGLLQQLAIQNNFCAQTQQDAHDTMRYLAQIMSRRPCDILNTHFITRTTTQCQHCNSASDTKGQELVPEPILQLRVSETDTQDLQNLVDLWARKRMVPDRTCTSCLRQETQVEDSILFPPRNLTIRFLRFRQSNHLSEGSKTNVEIRCPESLILPLDTGDALWYVRRARMYHHGSMQQGHFWTVVDRGKPTDKLVVYDDANVRYAEEDDVRDSEVYMALYVRSPAEPVQGHIGGKRRQLYH